MKTEKTGKKSILGYTYVLHSTIMYMVYGLAAVFIFPLIIPLYAKENGISIASITSIMMVGAFVSCLFSLMIGKILTKKGVRKVTTVSLILAAVLGLYSLKFGLGLFGFGFASIFSQGMVHGYSFGTTNTLIANWWPKRKGFMMGITTAGIAIPTLIIPLLNKIGTLDGMIDAVVVTMLILAVASWLWLRNTPEEVGCWPDNMEPSEGEALTVEQVTQYVSSWTIGSILKFIDSWKIILYGGLSLLVATGTPITLLPYIMEGGYAIEKAITIQAIAGFMLIIGSFVSGMVDQKVGPAKSALLISIVSGIGFICPSLLTGVPMVRVVGVIVASFCLGAVSNLIPSIVVSRFGRLDFTAVFRVLYTISFFIRGFSFFVAGQGVVVLNSYLNVYLLYGILIIVAGVIASTVNDKIIKKAPEVETGQIAG